MLRVLSPQDYQFHRTRPVNSSFTHRGTRGFQNSSLPFGPQKSAIPKTLMFTKDFNYQISAWRKSKSIIS